MKIKIITMGNQAPEWLSIGYFEYAKRLPKSCELILHEIPLMKRKRSSDLLRLQEQEGQHMLKRVTSNDHLISLDITGQAWDTIQLAKNLDNWRHNMPSISLLIGGPEGLHPSVSSQTHQQWSLSPLTLPHLMVRLIIAEQIYRAWSFLTNHPYHR